VGEAERRERSERAEGGGGSSSPKAKLRGAKAAKAPRHGMNFTSFGPALSTPQGTVTTFAVARSTAAT